MRNDSSVSIGPNRPWHYADGGKGNAHTHTTSGDSSAGWPACRTRHAFPCVRVTVCVGHVPYSDLSEDVSAESIQGAPEHQVQQKR